MDPERRKIKISFPKDKLFKNIWIISYNSLIIAALNIAFHIIMSRKLGPSEYGTLASLLSLSSITLISLSAIGFIVARFISYFRTREQYDNMKYLAQWSFIVFFFLGLAVFILNILISRIIARYLGISQPLIIIFGLVIWISFLVPIIEGIFRGLQEFSKLSNYKIADAFIKLLICSIIVFIGLETKSIIVGLAIASAITIILSIILLRRVYITKPYKMNLKDIYVFSIPVFIAFISLAVLSYIDIILVKHFFDENTVGRFAASGILAKIVFGISIGGASVMFPKIVELYSNGEEYLSTFKNTLKVFIVPGILITLFLAIFPGFFSKLFFGNQYKMDYMLSIYAIGILMLSISVLFIIYNLAVKRYSFIPALIICPIILIMLINLFHNSLYSVALSIMIVDAALLLFFGFYNKNIISSFF